MLQMLKILQTWWGTPSCPCCSWGTWPRGCGWPRTCPPPPLAVASRPPPLISPEQSVLRIRIRDPMPFRPLIQDPGWVKKSGSGSGMNNPDHISDSLETIFGLKCLNSLMRIRDPRWKKFGSGMEKIRIRDNHSGSATLWTVQDITMVADPDPDPHW